MVTKHVQVYSNNNCCSVLAKILMVTKLKFKTLTLFKRSVLAKILMVTKLRSVAAFPWNSSVLAKILMVTKLDYRKEEH